MSLTEYTLTLEVQRGQLLQLHEGRNQLLYTGGPHVVLWGIHTSQTIKCVSLPLWRIIMITWTVSVCGCYPHVSRAGHVDMHWILTLVAITVLGNKGVGATVRVGVAKDMYTNRCYTHYCTTYTLHTHTGFGTREVTVTRDPKCERKCVKMCKFVLVCAEVTSGVRVQQCSD